MMAMSPDLGVAGNILVFLICTMNWYNGLIVPYDQIQIFWRYWVSLSIDTPWTSLLNIFHSFIILIPSPMLSAVC